jgi:hypothetical protein
MSSAADKIREEIERRPGMKENEFKECIICRKSVAAEGLTFYRMTIERFVLDPTAIRQQIGLAMQIGGALASVMGPDRDLAKSLWDAKTFLVCESCACMNAMHAAEVAERLTAETTDGS